MDEANAELSDSNVRFVVVLGLNWSSQFLAFRIVEDPICLGSLSFKEKPYVSEPNVSIAFAWSRRFMVRILSLELSPNPALMH